MEFQRINLAIWAALTLAFFPSCLPEDEQNEDPFANITQSVASNLFENSSTVPISGFLNPNEYPSLFSSAALNLNEGEEATDSNALQVFFYALTATDSGEYEKYPLGTGNVNADGFFEFKAPEGQAIFYSAGLGIGDREKGVFTAPMESDVVSGLLENSVQVKHSVAMNFAASRILDALEKIPAFATEVAGGLNTNAIHLAGAIYEESLSGEAIEKWSEGDLKIYAEELVEKMSEFSDDLSEATDNRRQVFAKADHKAFGYSQIQAKIKTNSVIDLAHLATLGIDEIDTTLATAGVTGKQSDVNAEAMASLSVDGMDNSLAIAKGSARAKLRGAARKNFSGDELDAVITGINIRVDGVADLSAAKTDLIGFHKKSFEDNHFAAMFHHSREADHGAAIGAVFDEMPEDQKVAFNEQYDGDVEFNPDEHDDHFHNILREKCMLYGGQAHEIESIGAIDALEVDRFQAYATPEVARFLCVMPPEVCGASGKTVINEAINLEEFDGNAGILSGYEVYGHITISLTNIAQNVKFCKISGLQATNASISEEARRAMKHKPDSHFLNVHGCKLMGGRTTDDDHCYLRDLTPL